MDLTIFRGGKNQSFCLEHHLLAPDIRVSNTLLARIIHIQVNNPPSGLRLRPAFAGRRSGLAL
ncbi:MAG: hypothetical protein ACE5I0_08595, partial [Candidatus Binatia bacterium]